MLGELGPSALSAHLRASLLSSSLHLPLSFPFPTYARPSAILALPSPTYARPTPDFTFAPCSFPLPLPYYNHPSRRLTPNARIFFLKTRPPPTHARPAPDFTFSCPYLISTAPSLPYGPPIRYNYLLYLSLLLASYGSPDIRVSSLQVYYLQLTPGFPPALYFLSPSAIRTYHMYFFYLAEIHRAVFSKT